MLVGFFLFLFSLGYVTCSVPNVSCTIMNLEYIDCTWNENGIPEFNYTFYSRLGNKPSFKCPTYLLEGAHTVGCRLPFGQGDKFEKLFSNLSLDNSYTETVPEIILENRVKLRPPHNLSVQMQGSSELWLYWNISTPSSCVESQVSYRKNSDPEEKMEMTDVLPGRSFNLPFPSEDNRYTFQVRTRVMDSCSQSSWSAWSTPVYWGQIKQGNSTSTEAYNGNSMDWWSIALGVVCSLALVAMLVFQNERLRVILIPIVPHPSKTLEELLYTYNGNVEEWLHISKDFAEGFKPNFSEPACPVREYNLIPPMSINGSAGSLPGLLEESDCLYTSCSSSTSSIPYPSGNTPPGLV